MRLDAPQAQPDSHHLYAKNIYASDVKLSSDSAWQASSGAPLYLSMRSKLRTDEKLPYTREQPVSWAAIVNSAHSNVKRLISRCWPSFVALPSYSSRRPHGGPLTSSNPSASTVRFVLLCALWYTTSALSSNTGKVILTSFRYPITLTLIQFGFVAMYCAVFMTPTFRIQFSRLRPPTRAILKSTIPMGMFQVGGHMFSSMAMSHIPVSTVHTIKALSPLFTVAAYALLFGVSYSPRTYVSLLPLTVGVMLACSFDVSASSVIGLLCAFGSALVFVSSNIFFKKIMPSGTQSSSHKLDKLNLLLYSSSMAFILMIPIWIYSDLPLFLSAFNDPTHISHPQHGHSAPHSVVYYFVINGTVHFAQNIIAFIILASTSPVTYSIASLIKRVAVICIAIVWFNQTVYLVQGVGIALTFLGLYMYHNAKGDVEKGETKMRRVEATRDMMLPTTKEDEKVLNGTDVYDDTMNKTPVPIYAATTGAVTGSVPSGRQRTQTSETTIDIHSTHAHPTLFIQTIPTAGFSHGIVKRNTLSPTDPYPSPPASVDSPPSEPEALSYVQHNSFSQPHLHSPSHAHHFGLDQPPIAIGVSS